MQKFIKRIVDIHNQSIAEHIDTADYQIFHYTSPMGLNGIISNHSIRFTDRNYLNDYTEGRYVMYVCLHSRCASLLPKEYRKYFTDKCKDAYNNPNFKKGLVYQCSFSLSGDNLAMWNYYTKGEGIKGYNLCFSAQELATTLKPDNTDARRKISIKNGKVIYSVKKQKEIIKAIVLQFSKAITEEDADGINAHLAVDLLIEKLLQVGTFFKDPCFRHEKEYRLVFRPFVAWDDNVKDFTFYNLGKKAATYEKNGLLIPYVDIKFSKETLKQITASPTLNFIEVEANLKNALQIYGYDKNSVTLCPSSIPVRY